MYKNYNLRFDISILHFLKKAVNYRCPLRDAFFLSCRKGGEMKNMGNEMRKGLSGEGKML